MSPYSIDSGYSRGSRATVVRRGLGRRAQLRELPAPVAQVYPGLAARHLGRGYRRGRIAEGACPVIYL